MKRRNVDATKTRRPLKKIPKIYDSFIYTELLVYVKLLILWIAVMSGDFMLEFRLEYLYPIYLLVHNAYEAYKFQGVAFGLLLVCIVVSVDVICLGAIPPQWLYLLGSLAVWGQIGWSLTPFGPLLLLPTLIYLDGKGIRPGVSQPLSPLAAHCLGYPLVSLGFGVKSLLGSKMRERTRGDVGRQNDLLFSILWDALPTFSPPLPPTPPPPLNNAAITNNNEVLSNGSAVLLSTKKTTPPLQRRRSLEFGEFADPPSLSLLDRERDRERDPLPPVTPFSNGGHGHVVTVSKSNGSLHHSSHSNHNHSNGFQNQQNNNATSSATTTTSTSATSNNASNNSSSTQYASPCPTCAAALLAPKKKKDECCIKLESEVRRLRSDLHSVKSVEAELRGQISSLQSSERNLRGDVALLQGEHEALQLKYSALQSKSQEERQGYEKKLIEERRQKDNAIKKQTKASQECSGDCKKKLRDGERERDMLKREVKVGEEKVTRLERELQNVKSTLILEQKNKESSSETAHLMSLLSAMQDQNTHLESSLSAETRLKLDLFSALGEARRQLSIRDTLLKSKEDEVEEMRGKYVELLAVSDFGNPHNSSSHAHQQHLLHQHPLQQQHQSCFQGGGGHGGGGGFGPPGGNRLKALLAGDGHTLGHVTQGGHSHSHSGLGQGGQGPHSPNYDRENSNLTYSHPLIES